MSNYCLDIAMPEPRKEKKVTRPYDVPVRPESIVDLKFKKTSNDRAQAFVAIGQAMNFLGKTFKLKEKYSFAKWALERAKVRFEIVADDSSVKEGMMH